MQSDKVLVTSKVTSAENLTMWRMHGQDCLYLTYLSKKVLPHYPFLPLHNRKESLKSSDFVFPNFWAVICRRNLIFFPFRFFWGNSITFQGFLSAVKGQHTKNQSTHRHSCIASYHPNSLNTKVISKVLISSMNCSSILNKGLPHNLGLTSMLHSWAGVYLMHCSDH